MRRRACLLSVRGSVAFKVHHLSVGRRLFLYEEGKELAVWPTCTRKAPSAGRRAHSHDIPGIQKGLQPFPARPFPTFSQILRVFFSAQLSSSIPSLPAQNVDVAVQSYLHMSPKSGDKFPLDSESPHSRNSRVWANAAVGLLR